jgi:hypothetical protein
MAGPAEAGARDFPVHFIILGEQDAQASLGWPTIGGHRGVAIGRVFGAKACPEGGQGDGAEELGLAAEFQLR